MNLIKLFKNNNFRFHKSPTTTSGMTLVEVLISIVILGLLGIGLVSLQNLLGQNQTLVFNNYVNVDEANKIINQFVKEMRIATTGENGA